MSPGTAELLKAALRFRVKRERRSYRAAHKVADEAIPRFVGVLLTEVRGVRRRVNLARLMRAVASGNVSEIESTLLLPSLDEGLRRKYRQQIRQVLVAGGNASVVLQPKPLAGVFGRFDGVNPRAVEWAEAKAATLVVEVSNSVKANIRTMIAEGIDEGIPVRETARRIRETVGLTSRQSQSVRNFRRRLVDQGVESGLVQTRTGRFSDRVLRRRALNIARTETIDAAFQGRQELWMQARDRGLIDEQTVRRRWIVTPDDRLDTLVCFSGRTPILTINGWRQIRTLRAGDLVLTHRDRFKHVLDISKRRYDGMAVRIDFGGRARIRATATYGHKVLTADRGWISVENLYSADALIVSAVPCSCGELIPMGPGQRTLCVKCREHITVENNRKRWSQPGEKEKLIERNKKHWAFAPNRLRASEFMRLHNPTRSKDVREKIRLASLKRPRRPKKEKPRKRTPLDWSRSPLHPFRRQDLKAKAVDGTRRYWAKFDPAKRRELSQAAVMKGWIALGKNARGGSFLEKKVRYFLETQSIEFQAQWPYKYWDAGHECERLGFADFYLPGPKLVVECDGYYHQNSDEVRRRDMLKTAHLVKEGLPVLRFTDQQIRQSFQEVASAIRAYCCFLKLKPKKLSHVSFNKQTVYDITVEEDHSFVAGGIVAHNCAPMASMEANKNVGLNQPFTTGDGRQVMGPTAHPMCRCDVILHIPRPGIRAVV